MPLTLAIIQGFRVEVADETFILPLDAVVECLELPARGGGGRQRASASPTCAARRSPGCGSGSQFGLDGEPPAAGERGRRPERHETAGVVGGRLLGESQTVIKPLGSMFKNIPGVAGSSILGNGRVALILDVPGLLRETLKRAAARDAAAA